MTKHATPKRLRQLDQRTQERHALKRAIADSMGAVTVSLDGQTLAAGAYPEPEPVNRRQRRARDRRKRQQAKRK